MNDALERVILVDSDDRPLGTAPKLDAHVNGQLHRAFSVLVHDGAGNLLLQAEPIHSGSPTLPVNWRGDGQELVLLSGHAREGGPQGS